MTNNQIANILMVCLAIAVVVLFILICVFIFLKFRFKKKEKEFKNEDVNIDNKSKVQQLYNIQSIFKFMEFDKIEDNMIIQKNGRKFLMAIKCQGVNYDLMSEVEKTSVEQGFIQYLNTLRYPIQIYVQTRSVDLSGSISTYKRKVTNLGDNLASKEFQYNQKVRSGVYEKSELAKEEFELAKAKNLYEYGLDIVSNTERMSLNKNILSKQYYIIISYFSDEAPQGDYGKEEIKNMAFGELYTRAQSTISLLATCGISSKILDSVELANLLYMAYNRDEAETYDLKKAIDSGYDNVYTTAPDVLEKRMRALDMQIERDAVLKANEVVYKVRNEQEREAKLRQKEKDYNRLVSNMARVILENNKNSLGVETLKRAREEISNEEEKVLEKKGTSEKTRKRVTNSQEESVLEKPKKRNTIRKTKSEEESVDEQKKAKRAGRPRKTA